MVLSCTSIYVSSPVCGLVSKCCSYLVVEQSSYFESLLLMVVLIPSVFTLKTLQVKMFLAVTAALHTQLSSTETKRVVLTMQCTYESLIPTCVLLAFPASTPSLTYGAKWIWQQTELLKLGIPLSSNMTHKTGFFVMCFFTVKNDHRCCFPSDFRIFLPDIHIKF